jgi:Tfp pilus assembly protein PilN
MLAKQKEYDQKKQALETLAKSDFKVLPFLEKISEATPAGAYIAKLSVTADEGANITFVTRDPVETAALVVGLRRLDIFERVDIETVPFMDGSRPVQLNLRFKWAGEKPGEDGQRDAKKEPDKGADINAAIKDIERKIKPQ